MTYHRMMSIATYAYTIIGIHLNKPCMMIITPYPLYIPICDAMSAALKYSISSAKAKPARSPPLMGGLLPMSCVCSLSRQGVPHRWK